MPKAFYGHEFEQTPRDSGGEAPGMLQFIGSHKQSDKTDQLTTAQSYFKGIQKFYPWLFK